MCITSSFINIARVHVCRWIATVTLPTLVCTFSIVLLPTCLYNDYYSVQAYLNPGTSSQVPQMNTHMLEAIPYIINS